MAYKDCIPHFWNGALDDVRNKWFSCRNIINCFQTILIVEQKSCFKWRMRNPLQIVPWYETQSVCCSTFDIHHLSEECQILTDVYIFHSHVKVTDNLLHSMLGILFFSLCTLIALWVRKKWNILSLDVDAHLVALKVHTLPLSSQKEINVIPH